MGKILQKNYEAGKEGAVKHHVLTPFKHQVGGHVGIFLCNSEAICKPFTIREHDFYHFIPGSLQAFVPAFKGVIDDVTYEEDEKGYLSLKTKVPSYAVTNNYVDVSDVRIRHQKNGSISMICEEESRSKVFQTMAANHRSVSNPWGQMCQASHVSRMMKAPSGAHKFLVLENLVRGFRRPCVLDLKLGTRTHGDNAPEEKRISQTLRCQRSTSASLGLRVCGMQTYNPNTQLYHCTDKYRGRSFTDQTFKSEIRKFIGSRPVHLWSAFVERLKALHDTLMKTGNGFRFYSSSLLLLYDGEPTVDDDDSVEIPVDVRMIDFEHSTAVGFRDDKPHSGLDEGYLLGLRNLIRTLDEFSKTAATITEAESDN